MTDDDAPQLSFGEPMYAADGTEIGRIRGFDEEGFYVTNRDGLEGLSVEHVRSGHEFGEAELMWRCMECGEMGDLSGDVPEGCPGCGTAKESLMYWTED